MGSENYSTYPRFPFYKITLPKNAEIVFLALFLPFLTKFSVKKDQKTRHLLIKTAAHLIISSFRTIISTDLTQNKEFYKTDAISFRQKYKFRGSNEKFAILLAYFLTNFAFITFKRGDLQFLTSVHLINKLKQM